MVYFPPNISPRLAILSLSDCPIRQLCQAPELEVALTKLNLSDSNIDSWQEVEKIRSFGSLTELRRGSI